VLQSARASSLCQEAHIPTTQEIVRSTDLVPRAAYTNERAHLTADSG
jgi:hypothetical protein